MNYTQRCKAARTCRLLPHFLLCAAVSVLATACGGDGSSSSSAATSAAPATASDTAAVNPPSISGTPATTVIAGAKYSFQPSAADTAGDALTFSVENLPSWASFDTASGSLTGTPAAGNVGNYQSITISVSDGQAISQLSPFTIQVMPPAATTPTNTPPTISGTPATTVQAGSHYAFQPSAADADQKTLVFSITGAPSWASFSAATGLLSGTPSSTNVGTFSNIVISVSDGATVVSLPSFAITVTAVPTPPTTPTPPKITGTPAASVQAGSAYSFQPAASDSDGDTLTFSIANKPSWANFSATTGQLSGTPTTTSVGTYSNITITVSDGSVSASLPVFSIQVTAPPDIPPTISGTPPTQAQAGTAYSFTPTANSPSGKTLSFSVQNKPSWASFSISTGQITGTPGAGDVGTDAGIVITVSDGTTSAALAAFTITVAAAPAPPQTLGTATVSWAAPTQNTNGSSITNLAGYVISYGTSPTALTQTVTVSSAAAASYTVQNLTSGTWYFSVTATETGGTSSTPSSVVSMTVQ